MPLAETDAEGRITRSYIWSSHGLLAHIDAVAGVADPGSIRYYHADEQGSTLALTDGNGTVTDQFAYTPYGGVTRTGTTDTPYQWLGGIAVRNEGNGLYCMLNRYYSATTKKFISCDPSGIDGGANLYAYAGLNPLFYTDPFGLCADYSSPFANNTGRSLSPSIPSVAGAGGLLPFVGDLDTLTSSASMGWKAAAIGSIALDATGIGLIPGTSTSTFRTGAKAAGNIGLDDFVHVTPTKYADNILENGLDPNISGYVTKWKYVQDVTDPSDFNTMLYRQDLWPSTSGKFDDGAAILKINQPGATYLGPRTNWKNGVPQWGYNEFVDPANIQRVR